MTSERDPRARIAECDLRHDVIEKDYLLSRMLAGNGTEPALGDGWVFKGGTCVKKGYLETFRFSEILDFTVLESGPITEEEDEQQLRLATLDNGTTHTQAEIEWGTTLLETIAEKPPS